ncbi:monocarboxylate permease [Coprinopsis cinerea okayama7|uniref:Monocarboxylate permease n=1 Tax=Coprinopsis cinerea (strain Okayama-7 / 130 / ATCC MYA-4618 / FGSC 9003) TaxID=240176 RepID=A8PG81_COPC7|nr:monocarboxylate permease [Coprinopsis cinerea okayama7\|eukprot:XP_001841167.2 monocarboxylate permease [Coprinopsis cinerea okayama7\
MSSETSLQGAPRDAESGNIEKGSATPQILDSAAPTLNAVGDDVQQKDLAETGDQAENPKDDEDSYPDGGLQAWLVVVGGMCTTFSTFGYVNSWGIFQGYYQETVLKDEPTSAIAWIGSIQYALIFVPGLVIGRLFDLGYFKSIFTFFSIILVGSTFLIPLCTKYWHFLLCQGFAVGLACGCLFGPTPAIIAHWFKKRRGISMGIMAVGSSIGGTVMPIAARSLLPTVGFAWTMRIFGFIFLGTMGLANVLLRRRLPPRNVPGGLFNWAVFKSAAFSVYCVSGLVTYLGVYTSRLNRSSPMHSTLTSIIVLTYVSVSATRIGISNDFSFYFVAIANASSLFGRYTAGYLCDIIGPMNVMIPFTAAAGILTYAWPFAQSKGSLIAVTILYGFASGTYVSLLTNPIFELGGTGDVGRRVGMFTNILAIGAVAGPPISGAILTASGGFKMVGYYAGKFLLL